MFKKFFSIFFALIIIASCPFFVTACKKKKKDPGTTPPPPAPTIESIEILGTIATTYFVGDTLNIDGIQVKIYMSDETTDTITLTNSMISGFDTTTAGEKTLTVTYEGETATVNYTVVEPEITNVTLKTNITKTDYFIGDALDLSDGKLEITYENNATEEIDLSAYGVEISGFDSSTAGEEKTITITYAEKTVTTTYNVIAIVETKIELNADITKKQYFEDETLDVSGGKIKIFHNDPRKDSIIDITPAMITGFNSTLPTGFAEASKQLTLTITHNGLTTSTTCDIVKIVETKIELSSPIAKTEYFETETFNPTGGKIKVFYNDSTKDKIIDLTAEMTDFNNIVGENKTLTITYTGITTKTTTTTYKVKDVYITNIEVSNETPIKTEYWEGESLDIEGIEIIVNYNFGNSIIVNLVRSMIDIDNDVFQTPTPTGTTRTFTINYEGVSTTIHYIVKDILVESVSLYREFDKMIYYPNDKFNPTGGQLLLTYNNGDEEVVDILPNKVTLSPAKKDTPGSYEVTIKTNYANINEDPANVLDDFLTTNISNVIVNYKVTTLKTSFKTDYLVGESLDVTGGELLTEYYDGFDNGSNVINSETIPIETSMVKYFSTQYEGNKTCIIEYNGWTYNLSYTVTSLITYIKLTTPFKLEYYEGDELDLTGGEITITYNNGDPDEIINLKDAKDAYDRGDENAPAVIITGFNTDSASGNRSLRISYDGYSVTKDSREDIPYIVNYLGISSVEIETAPTKTEYYVDEELDLTGGKVRVNYTNGTYEILDITEDILDTDGEYAFDSHFVTNPGDTFKLRVIIDGVYSNNFYYTVINPPTE